MKHVAATTRDVDTDGATRVRVVCGCGWRCTYKVGWTIVPLDQPLLTGELIKVTIDNLADVAVAAFRFHLSGRTARTE